MEAIILIVSIITFFISVFTQSIMSHKARIKAQKGLETGKYTTTIHSVFISLALFSSISAIAMIYIIYLN